MPEGTLPIAYGTTRRYFPAKAASALFLTAAAVSALAVALILYYPTITKGRFGSYYAIAAGSGLFTLPAFLATLVYACYQRKRMIYQEEELPKFVRSSIHYFNRTRASSLDDSFLTPKSLLSSEEQSPYATPKAEPLDSPETASTLMKTAEELERITAWKKRYTPMLESASRFTLKIIDLYEQHIEEDQTPIERNAVISAFEEVERLLLEQPLIDQEEAAKMLIFALPNSLIELDPTSWKAKMLIKALTLSGTPLEKALAKRAHQGIEKLKNKFNYPKETLTPVHQVADALNPIVVSHSVKGPFQNALNELLGPARSLRNQEALEVVL